MQLVKSAAESTISHRCMYCECEDQSWNRSVENESAAPADRCLCSLGARLTLYRRPDGLKLGISHSSVFEYALYEVFGLHSQNLYDQYKTLA
jgi:hypothetical protein